MRQSFISLFFCLFTGSIIAQNPVLPGGFGQLLIADSLNPTAMVFDSQGNLFLAQKDGRILIVHQNGQLQGDPVLTIPVDDYNERGLCGIALPPDFDQQPWLYVCYTVPDSNCNRVSRFRINGNFAVPGSEQVLFRFDKLNSGIHNGGSMVFGTDGRLYVGSGDGGKSSNSQSLQVSLGKIIRLNADGSIPADNPFYQELQGNYRAIFAYGLRNPFSMTIDHGTGRIFVNDVGQGGYEEVNEVLPRRNYGWSLIEGPSNGAATPADYQEPLFYYPHDQGCAIVGAAVYDPDSPAFPVGYQGKFFFADYCTGVVRLLDPASGIATDTFATGLKQPVCFAVNRRDGSLWYQMRSGIGGGSIIDNTSSSNGTLWKVVYTGSGAPFISVPPQSILIPAGDTARFSIQVLGTQPLSFRWQKDEVDIPGAHEIDLIYPDASLSDDGSRFRCIVENQEGRDTSASATLYVTANHRPAPVITFPLAGTGYKAGDSIHFEGAATDQEDGVLPEGQLSWRVDFHHDTHVHPVLAELAGESVGSFEIPLAGEVSIQTWYRIYLTATDQQGLTKTVFRDIFPETTTIRVEGPAGLPVNVDGIVRPMPYTFQSLKRQRHIAQVETYTFGADSLYVFDKWDENAVSGALLEFIAPDTPGLILHARYNGVSLGDGTGLHGEYFVDPEFDFDEDPAVLRLDTVIHFDWGNASPFPNQIPVNGFTVRWTGFIQPYFSEDYTFYVKSDDGSRLWIGDSLVIDKWVAQASTEHSAAIHVEGGLKIPVRLEYLEIGGGADVSLSWSSARTPKDFIPKRQLYPALPYEPATIRGAVWHDLDFDGEIDSGEPLLPQTTVLLYDGSDASLLEVQETDGLGRYKFSDLSAGTYYLRFITAPGAGQLEPSYHLDGDGQTQLLNLAPLQSLIWNAAFIRHPASIGGICFQDDDGNGLWTSGEPVVRDLTVLLYRAADSSLVDVQWSDDNGGYLFNYLDSGAYFLHFSSALVPGDLQPSGPLSEQGLSPVIVLQQSENRVFDAPFVNPPGRITGKVWLDANGNQFPDSGEPALEGITLLLYAAGAGFLEAQQTTAEGSFLFDPTAPGEYYLLALANGLPQLLEPSFGMNASGQTPIFEVRSGETRAFDLGFKPETVDTTAPEDFFDVFPNPVRRYLFVENFIPADTPPEFQWSDLSGGVVTPDAIPWVSSGGGYRFDLSILPAGVYFLQVRSREHLFVRRIVRI